MHNLDILDLYYDIPFNEFAHHMNQDRFKRDKLYYKTLGLIMHDRYLRENDQMNYKTDLPDNVTEVFNDGQQAYYKVKMNFKDLFEGINQLDQIKQLHEANQNTNKFINKRITRENLIKDIDYYLQAGGLFNPEQANHDRVRDLLIDIRDYLEDRT